MFELVAFLFSLTFFLMAMFPVFSSPIGLGGVLVLISFSLVCLVSVMASSWYGYILFLVYIGGLLVLFIYVCMVSSNYPLVLGPQQAVSLLFLALMASLFISGPSPARFLGWSTWESGAQLSLALFVGLVILLLVVFLAIVRVVSGGGALTVETSK
uniref:NADH dehydrogenase subunit 6 n=1 Tax=Ellobium chinense TaxID=1628040 RepID=A0A343BS48_9EUPU|nr:NADH dehydrogenase subunit 6 [Ellobium chinense]AQX92056.1 NADH dehydrogenase subunit 6 [Ellobium chinense]